MKFWVIILKSTIRTCVQHFGLSPFLQFPRTMALQQNQFQVPNVQFRVLIAGRANSGKTSILQRVCDTTESPRIYRLDPQGQRSQVRSHSGSSINSSISSPSRFYFILQSRLATILLLEMADRDCDDHGCSTSHILTSMTNSFSKTMMVIFSMTPVDLRVVVRKSGRSSKNSSNRSRARSD